MRELLEKLGLVILTVALGCFLVSFGGAEQLSKASPLHVILSAFGIGAFTLAAGFCIDLLIYLLLGRPFDNPDTMYRKSPFAAVSYIMVHAPSRNLTGWISGSNAKTAPAVDVTSSSPPAQVAPKQAPKANPQVRQKNVPKDDKKNLDELAAAVLLGDRPKAMQIAKRHSDRARQEKSDDKPQPKSLTTVLVVKRNLPTRAFSMALLGGLKRLGRGGEAAVHLNPPDRAIKVFHPPEHEFFAGNEEAQVTNRAQAARRLADYPKKLPEFPVWIGSRVIGPSCLLSIGKYSVGGYEMPFVKGGVQLTKYSDADWKKEQKVKLEEIVGIFLDLYDTLCELHCCGVIVGDFKPDNVLVQDRRKAYLVDAESMAYGSWPCRTFSEGYVDPDRCDPDLDYQMLSKPYIKDSDWYAYTVMLFQALTNINPYDGVHRPKKGSGEKTCPPAARPLRRISVFNKSVANGQLKMQHPCRCYALNCSSSLFSHQN